ncbi:MAG: alpha/beta fold hydrolase [Candidatus Limnocylindria bacterium]
MQTEFVEANGIRFHCKVDGEGPLVLLLHGFPQFWYQYRHLLPALAAAGYRAVAPDMRGFGDTSRPTRIDDYQLRILGDDVAALINAFGERKAHVMGHDWGGIVASEAALSHPECVDRLILVNGPPALVLARGIRHDWGQRLRSSYVAIFRIPRLPEWWLTSGHGRTLTYLLSDGEFTPEDVAVYRDAICRPGVAWAGLAYYRSIARTIRDDARRLRGKTIASPTLLLWGERDRALGRKLAEKLDRDFREPVRKVFFPDVAHWIIEDRPDEVARLVIEFLNEGRTPA